MKQLITIIIIIITSLSTLFACNNTICEKGKGEVVTQSIQINNFSKIVLESSADVIVRKGASQKVEVKGQANIIDLLTTSVVGGKWSIGFKKSVCYSKPFTVYITTTGLESLEIDGSGDITGKDVFSQSDFRVSIDGSGDVNYEVDATRVDISINGSGDVDIDGKAKNLDIEINGSGDVMTQSMQTTSCSVTIDGSGDSKVSVTKSLTVEVNGSGDVYYTGDPMQIDISEHGSGDVIKQ